MEKLDIYGNIPLLVSVTLLLVFPRAKLSYLAVPSEIRESILSVHTLTPLMSPLAPGKKLNVTLLLSLSKQNNLLPSQNQPPAPLLLPELHMLQLVSKSTRWSFTAESQEVFIFLNSPNVLF